MAVEAVSGAGSAEPANKTEQTSQWNGREVTSDPRVTKLLKFGVVTGVFIGLMCGGVLGVFVRRFGALSAVILGSAGLVLLIKNCSQDMEDVCKALKTP